MNNVMQLSIDGHHKLKHRVLHENEQPIHNDARYRNQSNNNIVVITLCDSMK